MNRAWVDTVGEHGSWPRLLGGQEPEGYAHRRENLFESTWAKQLAELEKIEHPVDERLVDNIMQLARSAGVEDLQGRDGVQTILLVSPPGTQTDFHRLLKERLQESFTDEVAEIHTHLSPSHCPNLQSSLKNIIKSSIAGHGDENEAYTDFLAEHKTLIPMNFDLELLQRYVQRHNVTRVLVSIMDIEAFDTAIPRRVVLNVALLA